ncbi:MAG: S1 RNA-binding domain-containing protein, partial [Acidobacteriota bacterium]
EGLCHVSELSEERIEHPQEKFSGGDEITAKIIRLDTTERKVALSVKALETDAERADLEQYLKQRDGGSASLGELVGEIPAESGTALYSSKEEEEAAARDAGQLTGHKEEITEAESKPSEGEQGEPEGSSDPEGKES